MDSGKNRVLRLQCAIKNYEWGQRGQESAVGRLYALQSEAPLDPDKPYAELWMGTHGSGPSFVVFDEEHDVAGTCKTDGKMNGSLSHNARHHIGDHNVSGDGNDWRANGAYNGNELPQRFMLLKDWFSENPKVLGDKVVAEWGIDLPFLFKVLSVRKALSIQAHPNKQLADYLHRLQPNIYKDANHKPEMAFAITDFEALCGFVSPQELQSIAETVPELQRVLGASLLRALMDVPKSCENDVKTTLKAAFTAIMSASKDVITEVLTHLLRRLRKAQQEHSLTQKELLVLRLAEQYPGDVGILSALFLNYIRLNPGQALYLDANEPHAYLSGDCLECMATSDNVVRAGLTPKYIDIKTLCEMLTYKQGMPEILLGADINIYTKRYSPPFDEFEMDSCMLPIGHSVELSSIEGPSILLVLEGSGTLSELHVKRPSTFRLQSGDILFISAGTHFDVTVSPTSRTGLRFYRAGVNSRFLLQS